MQIIVIELVLSARLLFSGTSSSLADHRHRTRVVGQVAIFLTAGGACEAIFYRLLQAYERAVAKFDTPLVWQGVLISACGT